MSARAGAFEPHRRHLFAIAYRMLGSVADAEDVVQEAFVRYRDRGAIASPRAYLATVVTRLCIDHVRSARVRREEADSEALPEVVSPALLPEQEAELADSLSVAFLVMLQELAPVERAIFLLREVFDYGYDEIAAVVGKSEASCRQILRRARARLGERGGRFHATASEARPILEAFQRVLAGGDVASLMELLAPDVTLQADGGDERPLYGRARAIRRPISGAETVARFLVAVQEQAPEDASSRIVVVDGEPVILSYRSGALAAVLSFETAGGRIRAIFIQQDPEKLRGLRERPPTDG